MRRYLVRRLGTSVVTILGIVVVVFFIVRVVPGDPAAVRAGQYVDEQQLEQIREQYGLNDPLHEQFVTYLGNVASGDLGRSIRTDEEVTGELLRRFPASLELAAYSLLIACILGFPLGVLAAACHGTALDNGARIFALTGSSMALFWLGLLLIFFFSFEWGLFPGPVGRLPTGLSAPETVTGFFTVDAVIQGDLALAGTALRYLMLPSLTLGLVIAAPILKIVRASTVEALAQDYVRTARAIGVPRLRVLFVDGVRNALLPITTVIGLVLGYMLGGNVIVEFLFSWPGAGQYAYTAIQTNDLEVLQGFVIIVGVLYVALNLGVDLVYGLIDPRIRLGARPE